MHLSWPRATLITALLSCWGAGIALAQAPAFTNQLSLDKKPAATVVLLNTTESKVTYRVWYAGREASAAEYGLDSGKCHFYREPRQLACAVGDAPAVELENGAFYEIRLGTGPKRPLSLFRVGAAEGERKRTAELEVENRALRDRVADLLRRLEAAPEPVKLDASPARASLGSLPLRDGRAESALALTFSHGEAGPVTLRAEAAGLEFGRVRVEPAEVKAESGRPLRLQLIFEDIPSAGRVGGRLTFTGRGRHFGARHEVPFEVALTLADAAPPADPKTLTVLTWPPGAEVYVATPLARERPWERRFLGTTPVRWRPAPGDYQLLLAPPRTGEGAAPYPGRWACWDGRLVPLGGDPAAEGLQVDVRKKDGQATLVRAVWLPSEGSPVERLARATRDAADLFEAPAFDDFYRFAVRAVARAGEVLRDDDAKKLHALLRKCGYLRLQLSAEAAIDLDYQPGRSPPLEARGVRLPR